MSEMFAARRSRALSALGSDGALIIAAAPELVVGADTDVRYVPSADLYYLTGCTEPEAVLVLCPSAAQPFTMFVRPRDAEREQWTGARGGVEAAGAAYGTDAAHSVAELAALLPKLTAHASRVFVALESGRPQVDAAVRTTLDAARRGRPRTGSGAHTVVDPRVLLAPMRLRKDSVELDAMRAAADITVRAFEDAARGMTRASHEYVVEAMLEYGFRSRGAMGPAFPTIAACGTAATVLHYTDNSAPLRSGDLLLLDGGARAQMYCADITRTFPVSGTFTAAQRSVYDVVLAAHDAAVSCIAAGRSAADIDDVPLRVLAQGMTDLGLLSGTIDGIIEQRTFRRWFPHRMSHWLGLDVHDVGDYASPDAPVLLESRMVLTVEPGLYIPADAADAPEALRGIGVRLEDDVLVTESGAAVLTGALPIRAEDVERLMAG